MQKYCRRTLSIFFGAILLSSSIAITQQVSAFSEGGEIIITGHGQESPSGNTPISGGGKNFYNSISWRSPIDLVLDCYCLPEGDDGAPPGPSSNPFGLPARAPSEGSSRIPDDPIITSQDYWVNLHSGELVGGGNVISLPTSKGSLPLRLDLTYRSQVIYDGPVGSDWQHSYDKRLIFYGSGDIAVQNGYLRSDLYTFVPLSGEYVSPAGFYTKLEQQLDGTFTLTDRYGTAEAYNAIGRLTSIVDRNLNSILFEYDVDGNLILMTDAHDRNITLAYDASNRISQITDFASRVSTFNYNLDGRLSSVTTPATLDYPAGKTVQFGYDSDFKLSSITDPKGQNYMEIFYDNLTNRVTEQRVGLGSYLFSYDDLNNVTTVFDRNGNQVDWTLNGSLPTNSEVFTNRNINPSDPAVFTTLYSHNANHERTQTNFPNGNQAQFTFDESNADPLQRGNLLQIRRIAAPVSPENDIVKNYTYEPLFNQIKTFTEARGNDPSFVPQNGGPNSPGRFTTIYDYDYEEGSFGDLNGDGITTQDHGNMVRVTRPIVNPFGVPHSEFSPQYDSQSIVELFRYNDFGQLLESVDPEGNTNKYEYFATNGTPGDPSDREGFLQRSTRDFGAGIDPHTGQLRLNILSQFDYDTVGNRISFTDGRGQTTTFEVNPRNQVTKITSASPFNYETRLSFDENDNLVTKEIQNKFPDLALVDSSPSILDVPNIVDPLKEFFVNTYEYDILNNLTREITDAARPTGAPFSTQPETLVAESEYDLNENRVLTRFPEAVNGNQPNNVVSYVYDERDLRFTETTGGVTTQFRTLSAVAHIDLSLILDIPDASTTALSYDLNGNKKTFTDGNGGVATYQYDGFNRLARITDPLGNRIDITFDPSNNVVRKTTLGPIQGQGPGGPANPNNDGTNNVVLKDEFFQFDENNRKYRTDQSFFDVFLGVPLTDGPLTPGDNLVTSLREFDKSSRIIRQTNDNNHSLDYLYDGANRMFRSTDHLLNSVDYELDENSNVIEETETEKDPAGSLPDDVFVTRNVYDAVDRLVRTTNPVGETKRNLYDSRNNLVYTSDGNGAIIADPLGIYPGDINWNGNTIRHIYDGNNRRILTLYDLRSGGIGSGAVIGTITNAFDYDADGRLVKTTDDNSNPTQYFYDDLNRLEQEHFADGTSNQYSFDKNHNPISKTDQNGSVFLDSYDPLNRLIQSDITRALGVVGTTLTQYEYDGVSRLTKGLDNNGEDPIPNLNPVTEINDLITQVNGLGLSNKDKNSLLRPLQSAKKILTDNKPSNDSKACAQLVNFINAVNNLESKGILTANQANNFELQTELIELNLGCLPPPSNDSTIFLKYDSLDNILEENQNGKLVSKTWDGVGNMLNLVYPGGRSILHQYDELERISSIDEGGTPLASYNYMGPWRILSRDYSNGIVMQINYDDNRRMVSLNHLFPDTSIMQGFEYEYDRVSNVISELRTHEGDGDTFSFDSLYRIGEARFDQSNLSDPSTAQSSALYAIDGVNNWASIDRTEGGLPLSSHTNSPNNMNEYDSFANADNLYDDNRNLIQKTIHDELNAVESVIKYQYDAFNRLVKVSQSVGGGPEEQVAAYQHDAMSRRIAEQTFDPPTFFFYDDLRNIEEQSSGATTATYVDNPQNVNEHLVMDRTGNPRLFYHSNIIGSVHGLSDPSGILVETTRYDSYGNPSFNANTLDFDTLEVRRIHDTSPSGNPYLFTGGRFDAETGLGYFMFRYYDPEQGRFIQRDPIDVWSGRGTLGNPFVYASNNPINNIDPFGLRNWKETTTGAGSTFGEGIAGGGSIFHVRAVSLDKKTCCEYWNICVQVEACISTPVNISGGSMGVTYGGPSDCEGFNNVGGSDYVSGNAIVGGSHTNSWSGGTSTSGNLSWGAGVAAGIQICWSFGSEQVPCKESDFFILPEDRNPLDNPRGGTYTKGYNPSKDSLSEEGIQRYKDRKTELRGY